MVSRMLLLFVLAFPAAFSASGAEVAGVTLADTDQQLVLNGAGLRKRVVIHMLRDVDADQFSGALADGIKDNHGEAEAKALEPRVKQLAAVMAEMKEAKKGMRITLDWLSAAGTTVTVDGKATGLPIQGEDFYRALLRIWLGDKPVQDDLKKALLGEKQ